jgi:hypothetical protein
MSRFVDDSTIIYNQFEKIFNKFNINMKRECVGYFYEEIGMGHTVLQYFNDENNINLSMRTVNPDYRNALNITLNDNFFNMKNDERFQRIMNKIIEKYDIKKNDEDYIGLC